MNANIRRQLIVVAAASLSMICASIASANPFATGIGVQFAAGGTPLTSGQSAGVVSQSNFNSLAGLNFSSQSLNDSNGNGTTATLTGGTGTNYSNGGPNSNTDQILNSGLLNGSNAPYTFTVNNVPYASYSLIVYELDNSPRTEGTVLGTGTPIGNPGAVYLESPAPYPGSPSYTYVKGMSNDPTNPTNNGNYVEFTNLHGSTLNFTIAIPANGPGDGNANVFINGFQIINNTPEPSTFILGGIGLAGLFAVARRRKN